MNIISHRGYWHNAVEKNTTTAFERSFNLGFGTETDFRDHMGKIVISHDLPMGNEMTIDEFFHLLDNKELLLAINIKSDGLAAILKEKTIHYGIKNWFAFDMSIPDMKNYIKNEIPIYTRMSEVEQRPVWLEFSDGVWLDSFDEEWYSSETIQNILDTNKKVCIVSSELHGRNRNNLWHMLKNLNNNSNLILCTDVPSEANIFFNN